MGLNGQASSRESTVRTEGDEGCDFGHMQVETLTFRNAPSVNKRIHIANSTRSSRYQRQRSIVTKAGSSTGKMASTTFVYL